MAKIERLLRGREPGRHAAAVEAVRRRRTCSADSVAESAFFGRERTDRRRPRPWPARRPRGRRRLLRDRTVLETAARRRPRSPPRSSRDDGTAVAVSGDLRMTVDVVHAGRRAARRARGPLRRAERLGGPMSSAPSPCSCGRSGNRPGRASGAGLRPTSRRARVSHHRPRSEWRCCRQSQPVSATPRIRGGLP